MKKITEITINEQAKEVNLICEDNKVDIFKIEDSKLIEILNNFQSEIINSLETLNNKTQRYKRWNKVLSWSTLGIFVALIYMTIMAMTSNLPPLYPLVTLVPLSVSLYKTIDYSNIIQEDIKSEQKFELELDKIDHIKELNKNILLERSREDKLRKERELKQQQMNVKYSRKKSNPMLFADLYDIFLKPGNILSLQFKKFKRQMATIFEQPELEQINRNEIVTRHGSSLVEKTLQQSENLDYLRYNNDRKMNEIDRKIDEFNGRGRKQ